MKDISMYFIAIISILFGFRSFIAGVRNEKKNFWMSTSFDGFEDLFKNYYRIINFILGIVLLVAGILIIFCY